MVSSVPKHEETMSYQTFQHNRNYGCRVTEMVLAGYRAVVLENEKLRVTDHRR